MNFEKLFKDYAVQYSIKVNRGWVNTRCVFCGGPSLKLGFNPEGDYCTCFNCGGHRLDEALSKLLNVSFSVLNEIIVPYMGRTGIVQKLNRKGGCKNVVLPSDGFTVAERRYLIKRDFDPDYLHQKYGLVGGGVAGAWKYRIIIPIYLNGKVISWTARSILGKEELIALDIPRYKNLSIAESVIDPKSTLFNLDHCRGNSVILTEGAFDVMRLGDDSVCSFGIELSQAQVSIIKDRFRKVYVMFDNEAGAQKKARKFGLELSSVGVYVEVVDAYSEYGVNDGAELSDEQVKEIKKELGL